MNELFSQLTNWLITSGVTIVIIIAGAIVLSKLVNVLIRRLQKIKLPEEVVSPREIERQKRLQTVSGLFRKAASVAILVVALMMILAELGMDITPIIAGAGILGLAVGFGAQNLVRDVISGLFLILENYVRIGDVARINGTGGLVEAINLRTIVLRDLEGTVHVFPNGAIESLSNLTKEWSRYMIDVGVAYKENVDHVMEVLKEIGEELSGDQHFGQLILEPLNILGVDNFGSSEVTIRCVIKTLPLKQWEVGRELRRRIKNTFDERGIEIPFPHLTFYVGEETKPLPLGFAGEGQPDLRAVGQVCASIKSVAEKRGQSVEEMLGGLIDSTSK